MSRKPRTKAVDTADDFDAPPGDDGFLGGFDDVDGDGGVPSLEELESHDDAPLPSIGLMDDDEPILVGTPTSKRGGGRKRKAVVPPEKIFKGMSLFEYLNQCNPPLDNKIIDIAIAQTQVPPELKLDAGQDIRLTWSQMKPDVKKYKPGQIASYAHRIARHTALRLRRELGAATRLPGSAFRKKKDGSTYVTPGLLSVPLQWEELESWLDTDEAADSAFQMSSSSGSEITSALSDFATSSTSVEDEEMEAMNQRLNMVNSKADKLTMQQREILVLLIRGESYESVQRRLNIKRAALLNEIESATARLYQK
jgi:DNA-directed RNA polymerase specialized sigma24 family protein